ncbi:hypothetical protein [Kitasatospora sp. NPDC056184]|uniref:hypothetical protein n=1 Tax=Kitasatospora sp. NPDC056184 TaxID=3345738 RepID=UPI0035E06E26
MSTLQIVFEAVPGLTGADQAFTSAEREDGGHVLPQVVLESYDNLLGYPQELRIIETADGSAPLRQWLQNNWTALPFPDHLPVYGRLVVIPGLPVPAEVVRGPETPAGDVRVSVTWQLIYRSEKGVQSEDFGSVELTFGSEAGPQQAAPLLDGIPRHVGPEPVFNNFAAVDFGNTGSTATIYNGEENVIWRIDPEQGRSLGASLAEIVHRAPGAEPAAPPSWAAAAELLATRVLAGQPADERTPRRLAELLTLGDGPAAALVEGTAHELEKLARTAGLSEWLVPRLHAAYDRAFRVPPLTRLGLRRVDFLSGASTTYEVPSVLTVTDGRLALGMDESSSPVRGLKRRLRRPGPIPVPGLGANVEHSSDDLIALAFVRLIESTQENIRHPQTGELRHLTELVVTHPTTTPPDAQNRLNHLLLEKCGLQQVVLRYDEGVAAGLFFVMRDFAGSPGSGVEALRAASHKLPDQEHDTWRQTMLVVDIGGGTTDIALLGLTLTDYSQPMTKEQSRVRGRRYELRPEVLGSSGHPDLGGDYLTLRVYYLLKAAFADYVLELAHEEQSAAAGGGWSTDSPGLGAELLGLLPDELAATATEPPRKLAAEVLGHLSGRVLPKTLAPEGVAAVLAAVLPTGWEPGANLENPLFRKVWADAERAKILLGSAPSDGAEPVWTVTRTQVIGWLNDLTDQERAAGLRALLDRRETEHLFDIRREDFTRLAVPVFREAAAIAVELVQSRFGQDPSLTLDRIILCGRSTSMQIVLDSVAEEIAPRTLANGRPVFHNPAAIDVEAPFAKQATSIGAAWAHARSLARTRSGLRADDDADNLRTSTVDIEVGDLSATLPCDFSLIDNNVERALVFAVGTPYDAVPGGRLAVRSPWIRPDLSIDLHRPLNGEISMSWGTYNVRRKALDQGVTLDEELWAGRLSEGVEPVVRMMMEIDERLEPRIHFRQGEHAHHVVDGPYLDLAELGCARLGEDGHLTGLAGRVTMAGINRDGAVTEPVEVLPHWAEAAKLTERLPDTFHHSQDLAGPDEPVPGLLVPFAPVPAAKEYAFAYVAEDGTERPLGRLKAPVGPRRTSRYLSLDSLGRLRVHATVPPFLEAKDLRTVQAHPGTVYSALMTQDLDSLYPDWNPFSGRH